jgi:ectoine hydroxylase-related dioxygenase (phytanoyl-CoA dioxygenase family)
MIIKFYKKFTLNGQVTDEQKNFFNEFGFIHFENFITPEQVNAIIQSTEALQQKWVHDDVKQVNGVPIRYGYDEHGNKIVQRFAFTNLYSNEIKNLLTLDKLQAVQALLPGSRIGELEKDGVVVNHYVNVPNSTYKQLGWHTDSARDIFYGKKIQPMLNVGLYLDDSSAENGGLRILPGTHKQNAFSMLFRKLYFLNNGEDKNEVLVNAKKGDLVIHDGRMWHRVGQSPYLGAKSRRRVMYIPFIIGDYQPKNSASKTPLYFKLQGLIG